MRFPRARHGAAVLVITALTGCGSTGSPLSDRERLVLQQRCVSLSAAGQSAFPVSACERIVATISGDIRDLRCDHDVADRLLDAALENDKAAVRAIERSC